MLQQLTELELLDYLSTSYDKIHKLQLSLKEVCKPTDPIMQKLQELKEAMVEQYMTIVATALSN